jgi:histidine triad (HIT) family protein
MTDCPFCKISKGEIPTNKIYEDESTFAFLDIHPINPGHILVVPKTHEPDFYKLEEKTYHALMQTVKNLSNRINEKIKPKKVGLIVAGWDVPHTHMFVKNLSTRAKECSLKILPRTISGDGVNIKMAKICSGNSGWKFETKYCRAKSNLQIVL